jgi:hypothetical protein
VTHHEIEKYFSWGGSYQSKRLVNHNSKGGLGGNRRRFVGPNCVLVAAPCQKWKESNLKTGHKAVAGLFTLIWLESQRFDYAFAFFCKIRHYISHLPYSRGHYHGFQQLPEICLSKTRSSEDSPKHLDLSQDKSNKRLCQLAVLDMLQPGNMSLRHFH